LKHFPAWHSMQAPKLHITKPASMCKKRIFWAQCWPIWCFQECYAVLLCWLRTFLPRFVRGPEIWCFGKLSYGNCGVEMYTVQVKNNAPCPKRPRRGVYIPKLEAMCKEREKLKHSKRNGMCSGSIKLYPHCITMPMAMECPVSKMLFPTCIYTMDFGQLWLDAKHCVRLTPRPHPQFGTAS
jgi:hypothetical protein